MGGGSSINGGTALRSTAKDSTEWIELGNHAWDFGSVCAVYERLENDRLRGTHGPHPIARAMPEQAGKIQEAFLEGAAATGFCRVLDLNEAGAEGAGPSPVCRQGDRRISSANTFIDPIRGRANLRILTDTMVDKILFSGTRAYGVLLSDGQQIPAKHEIIVSAGAIFSPAILQRSGIGPSSLLNSLGIIVVADLPVGDNLSDHPCIPVVARPRDGAYKEGDYSLQMQARWSSSLNPDAIDLQLVCFSYLFVESPDPGVQQRSLAGTATGHVAGLGGNLNKPTSLGTVKIKSKDPQEHPVVKPNYLQTIHDRRAARELVRKAYQVMTTAQMQSVLDHPIGLDDQTAENDALLDEWINSQLSTTFHFCGSSRMAHRDCGGVVDQSGRVYGMQGLRVCDASIFPTVPASNTMSTTMMFAKRIGSSIRDGKEVRKTKASIVRSSRL
jgi:choline dehydrogenase